MPKYNTPYTTPAEVHIPDLGRTDVLTFQDRANMRTGLWPSANKGMMNNRQNLFVMNEQNQLEAVGSKDMTPAEFLMHLLAAYNKGINTDIDDVLADRDCTPEKFIKAVTNIMEGQVANGIINSSKEVLESDVFFNEQKMLYTPLIMDLQNYVKENINQTTLENYCVNRMPDALREMQLAAHNLTKNGVNEYLAQTNQKNQAAEKAQEQVNQSAEPQKTDVRPQKQNGIG